LISGPCAVITYLCHTGMIEEASKLFKLKSEAQRTRR
jgi:hypothetical protein